MFAAHRRFFTRLTVIMMALLGAGLGCSDDDAPAEQSDTSTVDVTSDIADVSDDNGQAETTLDPNPETQADTEEDRYELRPGLLYNCESQSDPARQALCADAFTRSATLSFSGRLPDFFTGRPLFEHISDERIASWMFPYHYSDLEEEVLSTAEELIAVNYVLSSFEDEELHVFFRQRLAEALGVVFANSAARQESELPVCGLNEVGAELSACEPFEPMFQRLLDDPIDLDCDTAVPPDEDVPNSRAYINQFEEGLTDQCPFDDATSEAIGIGTGRYLEIVTTIPIAYLLMCENGKQDGTESDVDCGGLCPRCDADSACEQDSDCQSDLCQRGICQEGDDGSVWDDNLVTTALPLYLIPLYERYIALHEFGHVLQSNLSAGWGDLADADSVRIPRDIFCPPLTQPDDDRTHVTLDEAIDALFEEAQRKCLVMTCYGGKTAREYWAEATATYFSPIPFGALGFGRGNEEWGGLPCIMGMTPEGAGERDFLGMTGAEWIAAMRPDAGETFCPNPVSTEPDYVESEDCVDPESGPIRDEMLPSNLYILLQYVFGDPPEFQLRDPL